MSEHYQLSLVNNFFVKHPHLGGLLLMAKEHPVPNTLEDLIYAKMNQARSFQ